MNNRERKIVTTPSLDKIAFLVHEPTLWKFFARTQAAGYETVWADELIRRGAKYRHLVSNHKMRGDSTRPASARVQALYALDHAIKRGINRVCTALGRPERFGFHGFAPKQYWPLQIGEIQIRFMYGADVGEGWSLAPWNEIYDAFLCHGPNDAQQLARRFKGRTFQMGYPRYDGYFSPGLDTSAEAREFLIDPARKTLLWMPTFGKGACSIPHFARALAPLRERYNFIVRPHPLSFRKSPDEIALLRSLGFLLDDQPARDMNKLLKLSGWNRCAAARRIVLARAGNEGCATGREVFRRFPRQFRAARRRATLQH